MEAKQEPIKSISTVTTETLFGLSAKTIVTSVIYVFTLGVSLGTAITVINGISGLSDKIDGAQKELTEIKIQNKGTEVSLKNLEKDVAILKGAK